MQLEPANVLGRGRPRGALQKGSEPFAAVDVASLRVRPELARIHVLDHALAQRPDRLRNRWATPVSNEIETPRSSTQRVTHAIHDLRSPYGCPAVPPRRLLSRSDLVLWPFTSVRGNIRHDG